MFFSGWFRFRGVRVRFVVVVFEMEGLELGSREFGLDCKVSGVGFRLSRIIFYIIGVFGGGKVIYVYRKGLEGGVELSSWCLGFFCFFIS